MSTKIDLEVEYDSGEIVQVATGQREFAAWEREPFGCTTSEAPQRSAVLWLRYLAFSALWRTRRLPRNDKDKTVTFDEWNDLVDEVRELEVDEDAAADPTTPGQSQAG